MTETKQRIFSSFAIEEAKKVRDDPKNQDMLQVVTKNTKESNKNFYRGMGLAFDVPDELFDMITDRDLLNFEPEIKKGNSQSLWKHSGSDLECLIKLAWALFERRDSYEPLVLYKGEKELFTDFYEYLAKKYPTSQDYVDRVDLLLERTADDLFHWEDDDILNKVVWDTDIVDIKVDNKCVGDKSLKSTPCKHAVTKTFKSGRVSKVLMPKPKIIKLFKKLDKSLPGDFACQV